MIWRPIETAPRDGTRVLVIYSASPGGEVNWITLASSGQSDRWFPQGMANEKWFWWCIQHKPTHWQPLPPPPEDET